MRWFRPVSIDVRLIEEVQRLTVLAQQLQERTAGLELAFRQQSDDISREMRGIVKEHQADYARLAGSIESVRNGVAGLKGGRPSRAEQDVERQALQLGKQVLEACATPEGALALAADLQRQAAQLSLHKSVSGENGKPSPV